MIQLKKSQPDIIISTKVGSFTRYVLRAVLNPKNIRTPHLTSDPEKAQRFWEEYGAKRYIAQFAKDGRQYSTEVFAPAAAKNN